MEVIVGEWKQGVGIRSGNCKIASLDQPSGVVERSRPELKTVRERKKASGMVTIDRPGRLQARPHQIQSGIVSQRQDTDFHDLVRTGVRPARAPALWLSRMHRV